MSRRVLGLCSFFMRIISWNVQGLGSKEKEEFGQKFLKIPRSRYCDVSRNKERNLGHAFYG